MLTAKEAKEMSDKESERIQKEIVDQEIEKIEERIFSAIGLGRNYFWYDYILEDENYNLLKEKGYHLQKRRKKTFCGYVDFNYGTLISW